MTYDKVAGRYALQREIGRGGSGPVWLAVDEVLGREVALKRIGLPAGAEDVDVARAEREARLAAQVTHPNVVAVFDFVDGDHGHWLVMEYVDGTDLARMVRDRGPLPADEAARILTAAARGLAAAHGLGIVHRDVKPSNILVGNDGTVKLSDFGIARGTSDTTLTQTGLVTGSPAYLAPEVATGRSATTASDVWSVGASLFHALSGAPPYQGEDPNPVATLYRIAHEPRPEVATEPWAAALIAATMTHDPGLRPTSQEVAARLADRGPIGTSTQTMPELAPAPEAARPVGHRVRRRDRKPWWIGAAIAAVLLVVVGAVALSQGGDDSPERASTSETATSDASEAGGPSAADLEDFVRDYVQTASSDPDTGFTMLTEAYQAESPAYEDFWGSVRDPEVLEVSGDPESMRVRYTYEYGFSDEGRRTEDVELQLVQEGDELLISGAIGP